MPSPSRLPDRPPSVEDFLRRVLNSRLLERDELQAALRGVPRDRRDDSSALADHLVRQGKLTRYQANKILSGVSQGLILGPFRILAPVGKGGMATVFLARDTRSGHLVALKVLPPKLARTEKRMVARFRREMDLSQKVSHTHIAWTYEAGEHRGVFYIAMEYIPGKTLSRLVADEGPLPLPRAARLLAEVASGLEHAHSQGLIHRDLKPSNIIITPRDQAKIVDLGLALTHGETGGDARVVGGQGFIVGTMDYISPEQSFDAASVDHRADIYSLGCTLFFALSGQPPYPGGTSKEKITRHRAGDLPSLAQLVGGLPAEFVALVESMMALDPDDRPASAAEVERQLRAWSADADEAGDEAFDETTILSRIPDMSEATQVSFPELEAVAGDGREARPPSPSAARWLWLVAVGLGLAGTVLLTLAVWLVMRR
jgi:eukaryotic-like serine/threonine-protein kinase